MHHENPHTVAAGRSRLIANQFSPGEALANLAQGSAVDPRTGAVLGNALDDGDHVAMRGEDEETSGSSSDEESSSQSSDDSQYWSTDSGARHANDDEEYEFELDDAREKLQAVAQHLQSIDAFLAAKKRSLARLKTKACSICWLCEPAFLAEQQRKAGAVPQHHEIQAIILKFLGSDIDVLERYALGVSKFTNNVLIAISHWVHAATSEDRACNASLVLAKQALVRHEFEQRLQFSDRGYATLDGYEKQKTYSSPKEEFEAIIEWLRADAAALFNGTICELEVHLDGKTCGSTLCDFRPKLAGIIRQVIEIIVVFERQTDSCGEFRRYLMALVRTKLDEGIKLQRRHGYGGSIPLDFAPENEGDDM